MADPNPAGNLTAILSELRDTNKDKRRLAVMKLGMHGGRDAVTHLIRLVENDREDTIVRGRAALMLGKMGDEIAVIPLIRALEAPGYQTPIHAVESLGMIGDARAVAPLLVVAQTKRDKLRDVAIVALKKLGVELISEVQTLTLAEAQPEPN